jgi:WD40 repeat protein
VGVSGGDDRTVRVWDLTGQQPPVVLQGHPGVVSAVAIGRIDGNDLVASGAADHSVRVWDPSGERSPRVLEGHTAPIWGVTVGILAEVPVVVSGAADDTVRVWDGRSGTTLAVHQVAKEVVACAFSPDPDGPPGTVRILKLERPVTFSGNPWASLA